MRTGKEAEMILIRLRVLGAAIALDDFGNGYCPHGYLKYCLIDYFNSDRYFARDIRMMPMISIPL